MNSRWVGGVVRLWKILVHLSRQSQTVSAHSLELITKTVKNACQQKKPSGLTAKIQTRSNKFSISSASTGRNVKLHTITAIPDRWPKLTIQLAPFNSRDSAFLVSSKTQLFRIVSMEKNIKMIKNNVTLLSSIMHHVKEAKKYQENDNNSRSQTNLAIELNKHLALQAVSFNEAQSRTSA